MQMILFPNAWTAEMHLLSVCVNYYIAKRFLKLIHLHLFPNSTNNSLIKTSATETFLKSSSSKLFSDNFAILSSSPFPKATNLKQRSLKLFVLRLFGKFVSRYPTRKGYHQFRYTHNGGPWTLLTLSLSNALSAALKTGGNGGWLTAVVRWHMQYLLRRTSWRRHDRSERALLDLIRSEGRRVFGCSGAQ